MKKQSQLASDIFDLYGPEAKDHFVMGKLLQSEEARHAWEKLAKREDINRRSVLVSMPEIVLQVPGNADIPNEIDDHQKKLTAEIQAIELLSKSRGFLKVFATQGEHTLSITVAEVLQFVRQNVEDTDEIAKEFFARFPASQKRNNPRLTFTRMLSSQIEKVFGHPLLDFCAAMGLALYPKEEMDRDTVRRGITRGRNQAKERSAF